MTAMIELDAVSASIAGISVLRGISATVDAGATAAIVGRNGAGKTTMLRVIMGIVPPRSGTVRCAGDDLAHVPAHGRSRLGIGYAPEQRVLFPTFTVEENLRLPCEVLRLAPRAIAARRDEVLDIVPELKPMLARSAAALSGGQGKMAALGRALMVGTRVLLLDEPFQGLAPVLAQQYVQSLQRLQQARPGLAILITESNGRLLRDVPTMTLMLERGALTR